jgi:bacterial leucyl aminopeptidase
VEAFKHPWGQNSIIAHIPTSSTSSKTDPITIISAHQDSTNSFPFLPAPGADDDGSGTTSILEAFRVLAESGFEPTEGGVEFHWYSAEEGGLLGSQAVATKYEDNGVKVKAMIQMDMTGWLDFFRKRIRRLESSWN